MKVFCIEPVGSRGGMRPLDVAYASSLARQSVNLTWITNDETEFVMEGGQFKQSFHSIYGNHIVIWRGVHYGQALLQILCQVYQAHLRDQVVVHQQFTIVPALDCLFAFALRRLGIPFVFDPHDIIPYVDVNRKVLRFLYRQCSALIVHSMYANSQAIELMGQDIPPSFYIPLGHVNDFYNADEITTYVARERLGIRANEQVILFAGQIKKEKGLEYLLEALPLVSSALPNVRLLVAGRPFHQSMNIYESLIDRLGIREHVITKWGYVTEHDLALLHQAADIVALPYLRVYQSASCITAYAFRRPVVAFNTGGLSEQIRHGETGYITPSRDVEAFALALIDLLSDKAKALTMGEMGHRWVAQVGDWDSIAAETQNVYHNVVGTFSGSAQNS
jgi:glycosyltransferase involved in cell wall biosynthesis